MNKPLVLRLNPALDEGRLARAYLEHGIVQIANIFEPETAEYLTQILEQHTPWGMAYQDAGGPKALTADQLKSADHDQLRQALKAMLDRTGDGYGFLYRCYPMLTAYLERRDPGHPIHALTEFLTSPAFIEFGARVTGQPQVVKADSQATYYRPGDFIGLHTDVGSEPSNRLTAYTLGFTRRWREDWGGQLLFHDENGDIQRGYAPRWNTLTLFRVPQPHSVAPVAGYAKAPRLSIVGWLRDKG